MDTETLNRRLLLVEYWIEKAEHGCEYACSQAVAYWDCSLAMYATPEIVERVEARLRPLVDAAVARSMDTLLERYFRMFEGGEERMRRGIVYYWDFHYADQAPATLRASYEARIRTLVDETLPRWS